MSEIRNFFYEGRDISDKIQNKVDSLVWFISRNEELSKEDSLKKIKKSEIYKKIIDVQSFYWTMPNSSIVNEYLKEK